MTYEERIRQIREHFKTISIEQFEINLERAGIGQIKPISIEEIMFLDLYSPLDDWETEDLQDYQEFDSPVAVEVAA